MKRSSIILGFLSVILIWPGTFIFADETQTIDQIVKKTNKASYYLGHDGRSLVRMTITDSKNRTRIREMVMLRLNKTDGGDQKYYLYFKKPSDVRKMVFLVHKRVKRDDDRWLYLPALDLVKRIAASDKRTSFVGSTFFYEDVSGRNIDDDDHEIKNSHKEYFVIQNTPKKPDTVEFSSYTMWINKQNYIPVKIEYLDKDGKLYRVIEALDIKTIQGFPTVVKMRARDLVSKGETIVEFKNIKYNIGLKDNIFTKRYLRKAPRVVRR